MCVRLLPGFTDFGFGKFPTNANNTIGSLYPLPILGKFLQTSTTNSFYPFWESSCKCQPEISVHFKTDSFQITGRAKQKKQWMFAVHHFCSNGEENSFQVWGDGTCSHTETQRLKVGTQNKDLCVFTNSAIIHLNYFSRTHVTTFFSIWTTWAASESSGGCAMPCRTLTVWGRLT